MYLDNIIAHKNDEVRSLKASYNIGSLESQCALMPKAVSLADSLREGNGVIAEHKRRSPSKGLINAHTSTADIISGYTRAGVSGISVLTDEHFFGGSFDDLRMVHTLTDVPLLCKEFVIDPLQIALARYNGASAVLLIAAVLGRDKVVELSRYAHSLGLETLLEVHSLDDIDCITPDVDIVGVNNRNLQTFTVDVNNSVDMLSHIPDSFVRIAESGIDSPLTMLRLRNAGFDGFLIGEQFMKTTSPGEACARLCQQYSELCNGL